MQGSEKTLDIIHQLKKPLDSGIYKIKCRSFAVGMLSYTQKSSASGHYVQILEGSGYESEREKYFLGGRYYDSILWELTKLENGAFLMKNCDLTAGFLCYTQKKSLSGHYVQVLEGNAYNKSKDKYLPGGQFRNSMEWEITPSSIEGWYLIKNRDLDVGYLAWTNKSSPSGKYAQVLQGGYYPQEKDHYLPGGKWQDAVLWQFNKI